VAAGGNIRVVASACQRERREANRWAQSKFKIQIKSKSSLNLIRSKYYNSYLQNFEIKYQETWFEVRNKVCHWRFFTFEKEFELKIRESIDVDLF
jgi:hypothetical protein